MPRLRRYRVFLAFAIISVLAFIRFTGVREWTASSLHPHSTVNQEKPAPPPSPQTPPSQPPPEPPKEHGDSQTSIQQVLETSSKNNEPQAATTSESALPATESPIPKTTAVHAPPPIVDSEFGPGGEGRLDVPGQGRPDVRWRKQKEHFPVPKEEIIRLPKGAPKKIPTVQFNFTAESPKKKLLREKQLALVKASFQRSWAGYKKHAWGKDELRPVSGGFRNPFMGWGATLVDGLDTLWIMGLKEEFVEAVRAVEKIDFKTSFRKDIPLFETVIRYLGGLIGAYDISEGAYPSLLDKAIELAEILMGAFDTPNRMPLTYYMWAPTYASQPHRAATRVVLAELGSLSLEFTRLAQLTLKDKYYDAIARITDELEKFQPNTTLPGLWPTHLDISGCQKIGSVGMPSLPFIPSKSSKPLGKRETSPRSLYNDTQPAVYGTNSKPTPGETPEDCIKQGITAPPYSSVQRYTLGALADSTYEYLPKMHFLLGGLTGQYQTMYKMAMDATRKYLLYRPMVPGNLNILFQSSAMSSKPPQKKDDLSYQYGASHLGCFAGGMFALGAKLFGIDGDMDLAIKSTEACVWAYNVTQTGIMPEDFEMLHCDSLDHCEWNETRYHAKIDPYEEARKSNLQTWLEQKAELEKEITNKGTADSDADVSASGPKPTSSIELAKRGRVFADDPSRIPDGSDPIADILGPKPTFIPHAEYVAQRIKEDRIPPGMTDVISRKYILRPEALESVFYMYRITGDESWRDKGWAMFQAIERATRTELGSSAIKDVTSELPALSNEMESFWLGETLKYAYLLFSKPDVVDLDEYVFNTEAHPFKLPSRYRF